MANDIHELLLLTKHTRLCSMQDKETYLQRMNNNDSIHIYTNGKCQCAVDYMLCLLCTQNVIIWVAYIHRTKVHITNNLLYTQ